MSRRRREKEKPQRTLVTVILDKSGSMHPRRHETISGYNEYVHGLRHEAAGEALLSLYQFDTHVMRTYSAIALKQAGELSNWSYIPGGMTALYDAIGEAIRSTETQQLSADRVLVVIMTDGLENSSRRYSRAQITDLMDLKRSQDWEFIFLGAGAQAWESGDSLGFTVQDSVYYTEDAIDQRDALYDVASASASVTRGSTAQAYFAVSPIKSNLEAKSGRSPRATQPRSSTPRAKKPRRATDQNYQSQRRDSKGRFIKS